MKIIHLRKYHIALKPFSHPLLDGARTYTDKELEFMAKVVILEPTDEDNETLVLALRSYLKHLIMRYLGSWPACEPYVDDMVSVGMLEITRTIKSLTPQEIEKRGIVSRVSSRVCRSVENLLNQSQSISSPDLSTQWRKVSQDEDPIYLEANEPLEDHMKEEPSGDFKSDVFDALDAIDPRDELDAALMSSRFWGKTEQEMAELFGVSQVTIHRRKRRLYFEYLKLTR